MHIRARTFMVIGRISCTVVTLGWLLGVTSPAWGQTLGDFNGDGFADLAIGVPGESVGGFLGAGAVNILYGSATGLSATGDQFFTQDTPEVADVAEIYDHFGAALAAGDFNGDGFADLAIGVPREDVGTIPEAGAVNILYGSANKLTTAGNQAIFQDTQEVPGLAEAVDHFGAALAAGDFNGDGFADLAIGAPFDDIGTSPDAGAVNILYGSATGLSAIGAQFFAQNTSGVADDSEDHEWFGAALAAGDFNGDGFADLAIGAPFESVGGFLGAGAVNILYGSATGLSATGDQFFSQNTPDVEGNAEASDQFGAALAAGDFNGDGFADLAIGAPSDDVPSILAAGVVNVLYGSATGLSAIGDQGFSQNTPDVEGNAEGGDRFGAALAAGDFNGDGFADLAIGSPFEDVLTIADGGVVNVLYGSAAGLSTIGDQGFSQNTSGVLSVAETNERFGAALAAGDFNGDGFADLAIGVPGETVGLLFAGSVNILYGSAARLSTAGNQVFSQNTPGVEGSAEGGDGFGSAVR